MGRTKNSPSARHARGTDLNDNSYVFLNNEGDASLSSLGKASKEGRPTMHAPGETRGRTLRGVQHGSAPALKQSLRSGKKRPPRKVVKNHLQQAMQNQGGSASGAARTRSSHFPQTSFPAPGIAVARHVGRQGTHTRWDAKAVVEEMVHGPSDPRLKRLVQKGTQRNEWHKRKSPPRMSSMEQRIPRRKPNDGPAPPLQDRPSSPDDIVDLCASDGDTDSEGAGRQSKRRTEKAKKLAAAAEKRASPQRTPTCTSTAQACGNTDADLRLPRRKSQNRNEDGVPIDDNLKKAKRTVCTLDSDGDSESNEAGSPFDAKKEWSKWAVSDSTQKTPSSSGRKRVRSPAEEEVQQVDDAGAVARDVVAGIERDGPVLPQRATVLLRKGAVGEGQGISGDDNSAAPISPIHHFLRRAKNFVGSVTRPGRTNSSQTDGTVARVHC